jgi:phosphopantetheinyl transferase (holo-ACP synthase)
MAQDRRGNSSPAKRRKTLLTHQGIEIAKFTLPKRGPIRCLPDDGYYAIAKGSIFCRTDDEALMKDLISRIKDQEVPGKVIAQDPIFIAGREKAEIAGAAQIEYFVRPLGIARVLRAIGGKHSKSSADMLAVLQNQGFEAIKCVCGEIALGSEALDISHRGYVLAERPLPKSAAVLDFPNKASRDIPSFVGNNISSFLATNWNAKEAFWKTEGLVDELAGTPGVFHEVIEGIKVDPNGPRIDIEKEVLPFITNDIYAISDSKPGNAEVDSRRNLIALRLSNAPAMAKVLDRAMENEPDAEPVDFKGHSIWKVIHRDDEEVTDLATDFGGDFGGPPANTAGAQPQPWLSNWAITVYDDYLMFASHAEMIEQAIEQAQSGAESPLVNESDYRRVTSAIAEHFGNDDGSAWQVVRTSLAYRVQYELFREGKLMDSQSMLASILDRLLQNQDEMRSHTQKLSGEKLPPYEEVAKFLQPMGMVVRTTDNGWAFGVVMLSDKVAPVAPNTKLGEQAGQGTARVSNAEVEAKR